MSEEFEVVIASAWPAIASYARVLAGDRDEAEDLLATVLLKACRRWQAISRMEHPANYLRSMITTTHIDMVRKRLRHRSVLMHDIEDRSPVDESDMDSVDNRIAMSSYLRTLGARERAVVVMRYYLDLPYAEIAAQLKITEPGARTVCSRALRTLRTVTPTSHS